VASSRPVRRAFGRVDLDSGDRAVQSVVVGPPQKRSQLDEEEAERIEDEADTPEVALQKKDTGEVLRQCLAKLSPDHREIIDLVYYHEKSVEEVAEIVDIPENTVKTRMFYARKNLAELLKQAGVERGWL
jgi:RNA polymerase sigma factor, sigma-70 family